MSTTSDPLGEYYLYKMEPFSTDICGGVNCLPDYPHAGYDAKGFYISVNLGGLSGIAATYALPKFELEEGLQYVPVVRLLYPDGTFTVQPSVPAPGEPFETAANGTEYLLEARDNNTIRVWAISNTDNIVRNPASLRGFFIDVPAENFASGFIVNGTEFNVRGPNCTAVDAGPPLLSASVTGARFTATIQKANGLLYGALPFASPDGNGFDRDVVAWFALKPRVNRAGEPSASILRQGYVVPPNGYSLLYPDLGLDKSGAGLMGFTITNPNQRVPGGFPSAAVIQFTGARTVGNIIVSGQGLASVDFQCDGRPGFGGVQWGDYGAATVDAATGFFYTANENIVAKSYNNWGTFITQVQPSPALASGMR